MLIYILKQLQNKQQLTNHINKQSLKPMGRWDITANKASIKTAGATARSTKWYIVNDQMVNELIFDILDYRILFSAESRKFK